jgi:hypothetical protein
MVADVDDAAAKVGEALGVPPREGMSAAKVLAQRLTQMEAQIVSLPLVTADDALVWRELVKELRLLADPLPVYVEVAVDEVCHAIEVWLDRASRNHELRASLVHDLDDALREGREDDVAALVEADREHDLLGEAMLRRVNRFYLNRLAFDRARRLQRQHPAKGLRGTVGHYAPLVLGVAGAPLSSIQTDKIWSPLLGSFAKNHASPSYHGTAWSLLLVCLYMLWTEVRRSAPEPAWGVLARRAWKPFLTLVGLNHAVNGLVVLVAPQSDSEQAGMLATLFLWGNLSLFMGVFLGLIAQGRRAAEE